MNGAQSPNSEKKTRAGLQTARNSLAEHCNAVSRVTIEVVELACGNSDHRSQVGDAGVGGCQQVMTVAALLTLRNDTSITSIMRWTIDHGSRERLHDQIAACVRSGIRAGEIEIGEQLPPAAELAEALSVDRNTVLAAYRQLRDDGVLEFRRGRGARVASSGPERSSLTESVRTLVETARTQGYSRHDVIRIIEELA